MYLLAYLLAHCTVRVSSPYQSRQLAKQPGVITAKIIDLAFSKSAIAWIILKESLSVKADNVEEEQEAKVYHNQQAYWTPRPMSRYFSSRAP
jgi:hypothetical protein